MKRGQTSLFVVLGLLIIGILLLYFLLKNEDMPTASMIDTNHISNYVTNCLDDVAYEGLVLVGKQGGYKEVPYVIIVWNTSYWYTESGNIQPFLFEIEKNLEEYVDEHIEECLNFEGFPGYRIRTGTPLTNVTITDRHVNFELLYPMNIEQGESSAMLYEFYVEFPIQLRDMYNVSAQIVNRATLPDFDRCNPLCNDTGNITVMSFNVNYQTIYDTQITFVSQDGSVRPFNLDFAVEVNDSYSGEYFGHRKIALVYYDAGPDSWTFGLKAKAVFQSMMLPIDYFDCSDRQTLYDNLNDYSRIIITGAVDYGEGDGCPILREDELLQWVEAGGSLYVNDPDIAPLDGLHSETTVDYCGEQYQNTLSEPQHNILLFPNDIRAEMQDSVWFDACTEGHDDEEVIIRSPTGKALLWTAEQGNGKLIYDQFVFSAGAQILASSDFVENLDLARRYYENVMTYMLDPCVNPEVIPLQCPELSEITGTCKDLSDMEVNGVIETATDGRCRHFACEDSLEPMYQDWADIKWKVCVDDETIEVERTGCDAESHLEVGFEVDGQEYHISCNDPDGDELTLTVGCIS